MRGAYADTGKNYCGPRRPAPGHLQTGTGCPSQESRRGARYAPTKALKTRHLRGRGLGGRSEGPLLHPRPEVRFSPEGAPLPRTRTQLLSNVGTEPLQPEPSNSRAAAFSTNQRRPRLTRLTNQRRRRKEVSRAFEEGPLNSNSSAR